MQSDDGIFADRSDAFRYHVARSPDGPFVVLLHEDGAAPLSISAEGKIATLAFLFTDIEGSTVRWERHPDAMRVSLARHDGLLRDAITRHTGLVFKTIGDAFCAAFEGASAALNMERRRSSPEGPRGR